MHISSVVQLISLPNPVRVVCSVPKAHKYLVGIGANPALTEHRKKITAPFQMGVFTLRLAEIRSGFGRMKFQAPLRLQSWERNGRAEDAEGFRSHLHTGKSLYDVFITYECWWTQRRPLFYCMLHRKTILATNTISCKGMKLKWNSWPKNLKQ